jgi:hypothetical protein
MFDYKLCNPNISILFLTFVTFLFVGSAALPFTTANAQNMTANATDTSNMTTFEENTTAVDKATGAENATAKGSISGIGNPGSWDPRCNPKHC